MPAKELMDWVPSQERWSKRHNGNRFWVGYRTLRQMFPELVTSKTKEGTREAANAWFEQQTAAIAQEAAKPTFAEQRLTEMRDWFLANGQKEAADAIDEKLKDAKEYGEVLYDPLKAIGEKGKAVWVERLQNRESPPEERTLRHLVSNYLDSRETNVKAGTLSPDRWAVIAAHLKLMVDYFGEQTDIAALDEEGLDKYYAHLVKLISSGKYSDHYLHDAFNGTFKAFIDHCNKRRLIPVPFNLRGNSHTFKRKQKKIVVWEKEELDLFLSKAEERTQLFVLLMLNCGFYSVDIATLEHSMVDWKQGRIIRKRHKEQDTNSAPTVNWKLWKRTFELLKQHRSKHKTFVLTNEDGNPLRVSSVDEGKFKKNDNIRSAVSRVTRKLQLTKTAKELRKTAASKFDEHLEYGRYSQYILGQSPDSVAGKHYVQPSQANADKALAWLGEQFGL